MDELNIITKNKKTIVIVFVGLIIISVVIWFSTLKTDIFSKKTTTTPTSVNNKFSKLFDNNPKPIEINNYSLKIRSDGDFVFNSVAIPKFEVGKKIPLVLYANSNDQSVNDFGVGFIYDPTRVKFLFNAPKKENNPWDIAIKDENGKISIVGKAKKDAKNIILKETPILDLTFETVKTGPVSFFFDNDEKMSYIYSNKGQNILKNAVGLSLIIK
jgi:hypothetical protein